MAFKGKSTIELRNAETGALEQRVEDENMVTNAVYNLINHHEKYSSNNQISNMKNLLNPLIDECFSGLLLFNKSITEDPNAIFPPAENKQIGYAADAYTGNNPCKGSLNTVETKNIENGKRYVWDFSTDKANGTIRCACLTSWAGGDCGIYGDYSLSRSASLGLSYYLNGNYTISKHSYKSNRSSDPSYTISPFSNSAFVGMFQEGVFTYALQNAEPYFGTNTLTLIKRVIIPKTGLTINSFYNDTQKTVTSSKKFCEPSALITDGEKLYSVAVTSENTFDVIVIDGATLEIESENTYTVQDVKFIKYESNSFNDNAYYRYGAFHDTYYLNGYYYIKCGSQYSSSYDSYYNRTYAYYDKYYKIDAEDMSNYSVIDFSSTDAALVTHKLTDLNNQLILTGTNTNLTKVIFQDGSIGEGMFGGHFPVKTNFIKPPIFLYRGYKGKVGKIESDPVRVITFAPFLSTINNLSTPVVKNETQTMKVTYEITEI